MPEKKKTGGGKTGEDNVPRKERDPACCGYPAETSDIKHRSCAPDGTTTYQFVQTGEACDIGEWVEAYKKYKCYPCKPGKTCDMGPGDEKRCKWPSRRCTSGCWAIIIIFGIFLPIGCFFGAVAVCVLYLRARIQQQPAIAPATSEEAPALPTSVVSVVDAPAAGIAPNALGTVVSVEQPPANQR